MQLGSDPLGVRDVAREAFTQARHKVLTCDILSDVFERSLWLSAFTGDLHVQVNSGMVVRCLWSERSAQPLCPAEIASRQRVRPPRLEQHERAAIPTTLSIDSVSGKVVVATQ